MADIVSPTGKLGRGNRELELEAIRAALLDAGLRPGDVDGLAITGGISAPLDVGEYLGIDPVFVDTTMTGVGIFVVRIRKKVKPSIRGISRSSVIASGLSWLTRSSASSPFAALPTTSTSELCERISVILRRL